MTTISVLATPDGYSAVVNGTEGTGKTPGQALDDLTARTGEPSGTTLVIVQPATPDEFFTAAQQARLGVLMQQWRTARDTSGQLPETERAELTALVDAEWSAMLARSAALVRAVRS